MSSFGREVKLEQSRFSHFLCFKTHFTVFWLEKWDYLPGTSFTALPKPYITWSRWAAEPAPTNQTHFSNRNPFYCVSARKMRSGWRYQFHCPPKPHSESDPGQAVELALPPRSHFPNRNPFYCVSARKMRSGWRYQFHCPTRITLAYTKSSLIDYSQVSWVGFVG